MSDLPLVSVITPTYNRALYLAETIQSVLSQDYPNLEYIVIDDGSTDKTQELLKRYQDRIKLQYHSNMGETRTVNKGYSLARGEIVGIVNSDDPLLPGAITEVVGALLNDPEAVLAYPDWLEIDQDSNKIREMRLPLYNIHNMLLDFCVSMGPGAFVRRMSLQTVGLRNTDFTYAADLELLYRLAIKGRFVHVPKVLATHRNHVTSASSSHQGAQMANELVTLVKATYSNPDLPRDLRRFHRRVLQVSHMVATHFCGTNEYSRFKHRVASYWYGRSSSIVASLIKYPMKCVWALFRNVCSLRMLTSTKHKMGTKKFAVVVSDEAIFEQDPGIRVHTLLAGIDRDKYCIITCRDLEKGQQSGCTPDAFTEVCSGADGIDQNHSSLQMLIDFGKAFREVARRAWRIARLAKKERPDAVVVITGDMLTPPAGYLAALLAGCPCYVYLLADYSGRYREGSPIFRIASRFERLMLQSTSLQAVVTNEAMASELEHRWRRPFTVIHNPYLIDGNIDLSTPWPAAPPVITIVAHSQPDHENCAVFTDLLEAARRLESHSIELHLYCEDVNKALQSLKAGNGTDLVLHTPLSPHEAAEVYRAADILFVPALDPFQPAVSKVYVPPEFPDYLASGKPILSYGLADSYLSWYIAKYACGVVADLRSVDELAMKIGSLVSKPELRADICKNAVMLARKHWSADGSRQKFRELLRLA